MKKFYSVSNILLILTTVISCLCYDAIGGIRLKALTSAWFVLLGLVNLVFAWQEKKLGRGFPVLLALGLVICRAGDIVLNVDFIPGALVFAAGHVFYFAAYCRLEKLMPRDLIPAGVIFIGAAGLLLSPIFDFGQGPMKGICLMYAAIISCMVGKSVANFRRRPGIDTGLLMAGSALFFFSDLMLVLCWFAGAPRITDTLCLFTYFPGQAILAHAIYWHVKK